jgi:hypothetical protein
MLTVGVGLAAEPSRPAIALLDCSPGRARLRGVVVGATDDHIVEAISSADKAGTDLPAGRPVPFVESVTTHQHGNVSIPPELPAAIGGAAWPTASPTWRSVRRPGSGR